MDVLWLRKPKCAGTSIRNILEQHCTLSYEKPGPVSICYAYDIEVGETNVGLREYQRRYPSFFDQAWKFTVVRNPWDKVISSWHYCPSTRRRSLRDVLLHPPGPPKQFSTDPEKLLEQIHDWHHFTRSQFELGSDENGAFVADYIVRFEDLPHSLAPVFETLGIEPPEFPKLNTTPRSHYREYYTAETRDLVEQLYAKDVETFGYAF
ncbi:MAG: hypothetical protein D3926_06805 [Desulfobacteraceae bacterium]|nr:MAG: hypothetical protein D3926_06805 [Desulfobacteraceae bacterium]